MSLKLRAYTNYLLILNPFFFFFFSFTFPPYILFLIFSLEFSKNQILLDKIKTIKEGSYCLNLDIVWCRLQIII